MITWLVDEAAKWLRTKDTDQWAEPWPNLDERSRRIRRDIHAKRTWIVSDGDLPIATMAAGPPDSAIWPAETRREAAVHVRRLVVRRTHAGRGIGAALLNWAGAQALLRSGARWIRVEVWTTNYALHAYYRRQGFQFYGLGDLADGYPSAALFQKPTLKLKLADPPPFREA